MFCLIKLRNHKTQKHKRQMMNSNPKSVLNTIAV